MNIVSISLFCDTRLNAVESNKIIQKYKSVGLSNRNALDDALARVDYITVLSHVWAERNRESRLTWLREKEGEMHAPLLFELAIAEFNAAPTVETVINVAYPLLKAATLRVMQDAACSKDLSVKNGDLALRLEMTYTAALEKKTQEVLHQSLEEIKSVDINQWNGAFRTKGVKLLDSTIGKPLPNPQWVDSHGMGKFMGARYTYSMEECARIRNEFALKNLSKYMN